MHVRTVNVVFFGMNETGMIIVPQRTAFIYSAYNTVCITSIPGHV